MIYFCFLDIIIISLDQHKTNLIAMILTDNDSFINEWDEIEDKCYPILVSHTLLVFLLYFTLLSGPSTDSDGFIAFAKNRDYAFFTQNDLYLNFYSPNVINLIDTIKTNFLCEKITTICPSPYTTTAWLPTQEKNIKEKTKEGSFSTLFQIVPLEECSMLAMFFMNVFEPWTSPNKNTTDAVVISLSVYFICAKRFFFQKEVNFVWLSMFTQVAIKNVHIVDTTSLNFHPMHSSIDVALAFFALHSSAIKKNRIKTWFDVMKNHKKSYLFAILFQGNPSKGKIIKGK